MARKPAVSPAAAPPSAVSSSTKPSSAASSQTGTTSSSKGGTAPPSKAGNIKKPQDVQEIALSIWRRYLDETPQRVKLVDAFMAFLVVVGGLQFLYCLIVGNYVS